MTKFKSIQDRVLDLKAQQESRKLLPCPRCGLNTMKPRLHTNALSRLADLHVCDTCGLDEAKLAFMQNPGTLYSWAAFQPKNTRGDFKAVTGKVAWEEIQDTQTSSLIKLYKRYKVALPTDDLEALRLEAQEMCKGLNKMWFEPFQLSYMVSDGRLLIEIKDTKDGTELIASLLPG